MRIFREGITLALIYEEWEFQEKIAWDWNLQLWDSNPKEEISFVTQTLSWNEEVRAKKTSSRQKSKHEKHHNWNSSTPQKFPTKQYKKRERREKGAGTSNPTLNCEEEE